MAITNFFIDWTIRLVITLALIAWGLAALVVIWCSKVDKFIDIKLDECL